MTPAVRLRAAASKLREAAEGATPGPWESEVDHDDDAYYNPRVFGPGDEWVAECLPIPQGGKADAFFMALMSPPVALAVADWLAYTASIAGEPDGIDEEAREDGCDCPYCEGIPKALALADAVLGSPE